MKHYKIISIDQKSTTLRRKIILTHYAKKEFALQ